MKAKHDGCEDPRLVKLARKINQRHMKLINAMRTSLESACEIGTTLLEAKQVFARLGDEQFLKWLRSNFDTSVVHAAEQYMRVDDKLIALIQRTKGKQLVKLTLSMH